MITWLYNVLPRFLPRPNQFITSRSRSNWDPHNSRSFLFAYQPPNRIQIPGASRHVHYRSNLLIESKSFPWCMYIKAYFFAFPHRVGIAKHFLGSLTAPILIDFSNSLLIASGVFRLKNMHDFEKFMNWLEALQKSLRRFDKLVTTRVSGFKEHQSIISKYDVRNWRTLMAKFNAL